MNTDPIADLLTRIRNATRIGKKSVSVPYSRTKESIAKILEESGIVEKVRKDQTQKFPEIVITFLPESGPISLKRVSKPGRRLYKKASEIRSFRSGYGISIISTSKGIMLAEKAKEENLGGELLCEVY